MHRITPSFIGTTLATIVAALYTFFSGEPALYLWTWVVRLAVICGPALALITYSIAAFVVENQPSEQPIASWFGRGEYWVRILAQIFLCLSLAALSENLRWYICLFVAFMVTNFFWSLSARRSVPQLFRYDAANVVICIFYAAVALHAHQLAVDFQKSYAAFALDAPSFDVRLSVLRGQQADWFGFQCVVFGLLVMNLVWQLIHLFRQLSGSASTPQASNGD